MRRWFFGFAVLALLAATVVGQTEAPRELFIPVVINGMVDSNLHFQTLFRFLEMSGTTADPAVSLEVETFRNNGERINPWGALFCDPGPLAGVGPMLQWTLSRFGSTHFGTSGYAGFEMVPGVVDGWIRIRYSGPGELRASAEIAAIRGLPRACPETPVCSRPSSEYESDALVRAIEPSTYFAVATVATPERETAFSIVNPSATETARVDVEFYDQSGVTVDYDQGGTRLVIPPLNRVSAFVRELANMPPLMPDLQTPWFLPDRYYGSVRFLSDTPIVVGALHVLWPEGKLVAAAVESGQD